MSSEFDGPPRGGGSHRRGSRGGRGNSRGRYDNAMGIRNFQRDFRRNPRQPREVYTAPRGGREVHFANANDARRGARRGRRDAVDYGARGSGDNKSQWYKVTIPNGIKAGKDFILRSISSLSDAPVQTFNFHTAGNSSIFFVQGQETADQVAALNRRITTPTGFKLEIQTRLSSNAPQPKIDERIQSIIKEVMGRRYDSNIRVLNLSNFRADAAFQEQGDYIPITRSNIAAFVVKVITENIPEIVGLDISDNQLQSIETFAEVREKCSNLRALNLSKNKIRNMSELEYLKGLNLEELHLAENPLVNNFKDTTIYISSIRTRFPKVVKLDGETLPPAIGFDVGEEKLQIPDTLGSHIPEEIKPFVFSFLEQFFGLYDSDKRQDLMAAYHEHATFSFSISKVEQGNPKAAFTGGVLGNSRNLMRIQMSGRSKLLKQGKVNIVAFLNEFPPSEHKSDSFLIDVPFHTNSMIILAVNGVYLENHDRIGYKMPRFFCRMFTIVPHNQGFVIINDQLMVGSATYQQKQKYEARATDTAMPSVSSIGSVGGSTVQATLDENRLIEQFARETKMTASFSRQCLEENQYNFNTALDVFYKLNKLGLIPKEAFL